jgi:hypothetical protein
VSNFLLSVGGSGAKFTEALIHLGAAGFLPAHRRELFVQLVDPDENNGNVDACLALHNTYRQCRETIGVNLGTSDFLSSAIQVDGPWTPVDSTKVDSLRAIFQLDKLERAGSMDAELLQLLFERPELDMSIAQGFRGRPAIGATVLAQAVNFEREPWLKLRDLIKERGKQGGVHVLLAGSVFGGSGASGVPTLVRLLERELRDDLAKLRLGLVLMLPFFSFRPVQNEAIQADPAAFHTATAEALKYYHEHEFLRFCHSIYCVGEEVPTDVAVSAVGAREQRNAPHFVELIAGMGGMRFFNDQAPSTPSSLAVASRREDHTLAWEDLPYDGQLGKPLVNKLQSMAAFAVAYRYLFFPVITDAVKRGTSHAGFWVDHVARQKVRLDDADRALRLVHAYLEQFLIWLMHVSTPRRENFAPGLVNTSAFAVRDGDSWRLKKHDEFNDADFSKLILNSAGKIRLDARQVFQKAAQPVRDSHASGVGRVVRALYDSCRIA